MAMSTMMAQSIDTIPITTQKGEMKGEMKVPTIEVFSDKLPIIYLDIVFANSGQIANNIAGTSYFTAKLFNEGSAKKPFEQFHRALENRAINLSVSSGEEFFSFSLSSLSESFEEGLLLLKELINNPHLSDEAFEKATIMTKGILLQNEQNFDEVAENGLYQMLFKQTPYEYPINGTLESLEQIDKKTVRAFIDKQLVLENATVLLAGDYNNSIRRKIADILTTIPSKAQKPKATNAFKIATKRQHKAQHKTTQQAYIYFGSPYNIAYDDEEMYKAKVAFFILGSSGFGSRLMEKIRVQEGLAYSVYAYLKTKKSYTIFKGYMQTSLDHQDKAIALIKEEINQFVKKGVTQEELDSAKKFILGSEPLKNETLDQRLWRKFNNHYKNLPLDDDQTFLDNVEKLSLKSLNTFIQSHDEINDLFFSIVTQVPEEKEK